MSMKSESEIPVAANLLGRPNFLKINN